MITIKLKKISLLLAILTITVNVWAYDFEVDGIFYNKLEDGMSIAVTSGDADYKDNIVIPAQVTYNDVTYSVIMIEGSAFSFCNNLKSITIPNSVTTIGKRAFMECSSLTSIEIPHSLNIIEDYLFSGCTSLKAIEIPNSITSIGQRGFSGCSSLSSVKISESVLTIGAAAFEGCSELIEIKIPNSVTSMGYGVFYYCTNLRSVELPNSLTDIKFQSFSGCRKLTDVEIPNSVQSIGESAFSNCNSLSSVTIPNSVITIESGAFSQCTHISSVLIGSNVSRIGNNAFSGCSYITSLTTLATTPPTCGINVFEGSIQKECVLHVPVNCINAYKGADEWKYFHNIDDGIVSTNNIVFDNSSEIRVQERTIDFIGFEKSINIYIYDIKGAMIYSGIAQRIKLNNGLYIVKYGNRIIKIKI